MSTLATQEAMGQSAVDSSILTLIYTLVPSARAPQDRYHMQLFDTTLSPEDRLRHALKQAFEQKTSPRSGSLLQGIRYPQLEEEKAPEKPEKVFSDNWFARRYFFLFKKNLSVTNIQFAELFALMRTHIRNPTRGGGAAARPPSQLQLLSRSDFRTFIDHVLYDISLSSDVDEAIEFTVKTFQSVFDRTVLIAQFNGSCATFLPAHLDLDLELICGESGYIHSCGHLVYLRNVEKATKERFLANLCSHVDVYYAEGHRAALIPYSHEAFTRHDEHERDMLRGGLDDVKIHTTKYFIWR